MKLLAYFIAHAYEDIYSSDLSLFGDVYSCLCCPLI